MDIWTQIQFLTIPGWLRAVIVTLTGLLFSICLYMFAVSFMSPDKPSMMEAGAYLTGVIFPITLVIVFISGVQSGVSSIQNGLDSFLTQTVPSILSKIPEQPTRFHDWHPGERHPEALSNNPAQSADISINHVKNNCYADYRIGLTLPDQRKLSCFIRLEVNVRRVNFNLYLDPVVVLPMAGVTAKDDAGGQNDKVVAMLSRKLSHSLFGAEIATEVRHHTSRAMIERPKEQDEGYQFNKTTLFHRRLHDKEMYLLCGARSVSEDMLWHSAEKLYFSQDLMFMLRAIIYEAPELFAVA